MNLIEITPIQLLLCLLFVLVAGAGSVALQLGLEKDLACAGGRYEVNTSVLQLLCPGHKPGIFSFHLMTAQQPSPSKLGDQYDMDHRSGFQTRP